MIELLTRAVEDESGAINLEDAASIGSIASHVIGTLNTLFGQYVLYLHVHVFSLTLASSTAKTTVAILALLSYPTASDLDPSSVQSTSTLQVSSRI